MSPPRDEEEIASAIEQLEVPTEDDHQLAEEIADNLGFPFQNTIPKPNPRPDTDSDESTPEGEEQGAEFEEAGEAEGDEGEENPHQEEEGEEADEQDVRSREGFNKKLAKLQKRQRTMEAEIRVHQEKSKAFDYLFNAPDPAQAIAGLKASMGVQGAPAKGQPSAHPLGDIDGLVNAIPKQLTERFDAPKDVVELVLHVIQQGLIPGLMSEFMPVKAAVQQYLQGQAKTEEESVLSSYPSADKYIAKAKVYAREHNASLEDALLVVSKGAIVLDRKRQVRQEKISSGRQAQFNGVPPKRVVSRREDEGDVDEARLAQELIEIDRKTGSNRYYPNRLKRRS